MRASIITLHTVNNYGSVMQTYATQRVFQKLGCEVEFVDYWRKSNTPREKAEKLLTNSSLLKKWSKVWESNQVIRNVVLYLLESYIVRKKYPTWKFVKNNICLSKTRYYSYEALQKNPPLADVYVTGSDQVWNSIWNGGIDKAYFLEYAPANKPRIAFSASIGREKLDFCEATKTKQMLECYKAISVREQSAVKLLASMSVKSTLILDPTLMLDANDWRKLAKRVRFDKPYILIYQLNSNLQMDEYALKLAEKKKWEIVRIGFGHSDRKKAGKCVMEPSVESFLGLFFQATCVLTDSFHATAFSLNLGTDFVTVLPNEFGTRIESILNLTETEDRLLLRFDDFEIVDKPIDKAKVKMILDRKRADGTKWLEAALEIGKENL